MALNGFIWRIGDGPWRYSTEDAIDTTGREITKGGQHEEDQKMPVRESSPSRTEAVRGLPSRTADEDVAGREGPAEEGSSVT